MDTFVENKHQIYSQSKDNFYTESIRIGKDLLLQISCRNKYYNTYLNLQKAKMDQYSNNEQSLNSQNITADISVGPNQSAMMFANSKDSSNMQSFDESISLQKPSKNEEYPDQSALLTGSLNANQKAILTQSIKRLLAILEIDQCSYIQSKPIQLQTSNDSTSKEMLQMISNAHPNCSDIHFDQCMFHLTQRVHILKIRSIERKKQILRMSNILKQHGIDHKILTDLNESSSQSLQISFENKAEQENHYKKKYLQYKQKCKRYQEKINKLKQITK